MKGEWKAAIHPPRDDAGSRLFIWSDAGDGKTGVITKLGEDTEVSVHNSQEVSDFRGIAFPQGVAEAIIAALNPPAHIAEIRRLEDALAWERARVDHALGMSGS